MPKFRRITGDHLATQTLWSAVDYDNAATVKRALRDGGNPRAKAPRMGLFKYGLVAYAVRHNRYDSLRALLEAGVPDLPSQFPGEHLPASRTVYRICQRPDPRAWQVFEEHARKSGKRLDAWHPVGPQGETPLSSLVSQRRGAAAEGWPEWPTFANNWWAIPKHKVPMKAWSRLLLDVLRSGNESYLNHLLQLGVPWSRLNLPATDLDPAISQGTPVRETSEQRWALLARQGLGVAWPEPGTSRALDEQRGRFEAVQLHAALDSTPPAPSARRMRV
jgi:hypothetical protein